MLKWFKRQKAAPAKDWEAIAKKALQALDFADMLCSQRGHGDLVLAAIYRDTRDHARKEARK